jgi:hypothetical protein
MMDATILQDRASRGLGVAARRVGARTDAFRPRGVSDPLAPANRFLRLHAAFSAPDGRFQRPNAYGSPLWHGTFDTAYTKPGDYLVQPAGTWFVAAQQPLLPVLCVETNRIASFVRPAAPGGVGVNGYGGVALSTATPLLSRWPASVLTAGSGMRPSANLPSDSTTATWTVLLPAIRGIVLRPADLMTDDLERTGTISTAELTDLGWRLTVKQTST